MKLLGKSLTLISITRQSIFDASFACACENCGKTIVNMATVQDTDGTKYTIGLDCKKTLIDKPVIDKLKKSGDFMDKYEAKEYTRKINDAEKFVSYAGNPCNTITTDGSWIMINDDKPNKIIETVVGNTIFSESIGYLSSIGLRDFIQQLKDSGKITFRR